MKLAFRIVAIVVAIGSAWFVFSRDRIAEPAQAVAATAPPSKLEHEAPHVDVQPPAEVPHDEPAREAVATPAPDVALSKAAPGTVALLRVHVIAQETRKPLAGKSVGSHPSDATRWIGVESKTSHAAVGEMATTDDDGRAELEVEPGHELNVDVIDPFHANVVVPALTAGEQRDVEVEIRTAPDITLFGRLVDAQTGQAVGDGVLWLESSGRRGRSSGEDHAPSDEFHTDAQGRFELTGRSWEEKFVNAKAEGFARTVFALKQGHDSAERALEVRMSRAATLEVSVSDGKGRVADARVELTTESYRLQQDDGMLHFYSVDDARWTARTDAFGRADVVDLAPEVPLQLSVTATGKAPRKEGESITLQPGERRKIELRLGSGASVVGRIEDQTGAAVAGCTLWRLAGDDEGFDAMIRGYSKPAASTRADEQGRFRFDDVAVGSWLIGPKPDSGRAADASDRQAFPPVGQIVRVEADSSVVEVVLRIDRGLYLTGTVLDPTGAPASEVSVVAIKAPSVFLNVSTDATGHFTVGPMPAGAYLIQANGFRGPHAKSEDLHVEAGDGALVLHLRPGGTIRGRVIDAAAKPRECLVSVANEAQRTAGFRTSTRDGNLEFKGLLAGTYTISATTSDGLCGRRSGIVVEAGATADGVEVVLEPGAKLSVRFDGQAGRGYFEVLLAGVTFTGDNPDRGKASVIVVPAGEIEVRWYDTYPNVAHSERLTLSAGQTREVVWDGK